MQSSSSQSEETGEAIRSSQAERFVEGFRAAWAAPRIERLSALLHPEVRLYQPVTPPTIGFEAAAQSLQQVLELMPDIRGEVHRWSAQGDAVYIEFTFAATIGSRPFRWKLVDRFILEGGLAIERVSFFDPLPLLAAVLTRPSAWKRWWRMGLSAFRSPSGAA